MRVRHLIIGVGLALLLSGCVQAVYDETPTVPATVVSATSTPLVPFELSPAAVPVEALPPSLYLEPAVVEVAVGETATVNIWVDGVQGLNGIRVELSFDPAHVRVEDADAGAEGVQIAPGRMPPPGRVMENRVDEEGGRIVYQVALDPGAGVDGSGVVASFTLRGVSEGGSPLRFEEVMALDPEGNELEIAPLSDGLVTVTGGAGEGEAVQPTAAPTVGLTPVPSPQPSPQPGAGGIYYVVQPGENLFRIGLKFGTTAQAIAAANGIDDPGRVQAGAMILVPVPPPQGTYGYYVQPRDTLYSIARRFGMEVDALAALNGIGPDYRIEVGQVLVVSP